MPRNAMSLQEPYPDGDCHWLSALGYSGGTDETDSSGVLNIVIAEAGPITTMMTMAIGLRGARRTCSPVCRSRDGNRLCSNSRNGWNFSAIDGGSVNISAVAVSAMKRQY